jgi:hypothetical protein
LGIQHHNLPLRTDAALLGGFRFLELVIDWIDMSIRLVSMSIGFHVVVVVIVIALGGLHRRSMTYPRVSIDEGTQLIRCLRCRNHERSRNHILLDPLLSSCYIFTQIQEYICSITLLIETHFRISNKKPK